MGYGTLYLAPVGARQAHKYDCARDSATGISWTLVSKDFPHSDMDKGIHSRWLPIGGR